MTEINGHDLPPAGVESEKSRWLATRRGALPHLSQEPVVDQFPNQAGDRGSGQTGEAGQLGTGGGPTLRDQVESGLQVGAARVVLGGLGTGGAIGLTLVGLEGRHESSLNIQTIEPGCQAIAESDIWWALRSSEECRD